jgi:hypothetical protein
MLASTFSELVESCATSAEPSLIFMYPAVIRLWMIHCSGPRCFVRNRARIRCPGILVLQWTDADSTYRLLAGLSRVPPRAAPHSGITDQGMLELVSRGRREPAQVKQVGVG